MYAQMRALRCSIVRGGTSKGVFLRENELPEEPGLRDKVILSVFGSPDVRQIDGLGGADVLTSKLAIIAPPSRADADVDYTFAQVSFEKAFVDYKGNCGNISSAVGPYAIDEGMVKAVEPYTDVRIHLTNSGRILKARVPVVKGKAAVEGAYTISGVPGTGAKIDLDWSDTCGALTGELLPTGKAREEIEAGGVSYTVSLVDAGNPLVFIAAKSLGMAGGETAAEIEGDKELMATIEQIRGEAARRFGLVADAKRAAAQSPYIPFFAIVSPPAPYTALNGTPVEAREVDIVARLLFMQKMHKAYPVTGTICTGAACRVEGSVARQALGETAGSVIRIGHPSGVIQVEAVGGGGAQGVRLEKLATSRTARRIMDGLVYVRESVYTNINT
jgi:2-methylaconitate cis-trans-isomerase PrpF